MLIVGVDVGSVRRAGGFSWAAVSAGGRVTACGADEPAAVASVIAARLSEGVRVAVAFECPLAVPIPRLSPEGGRELGRARTGEGNRAWSAGAGSGALATGLAQLTWLCGYLAAHAPRCRATTQLARFVNEGATVLLTEAMVTADGKPEPIDGCQDSADAVSAARRLAELLAAPEAVATSEVRCAPHTALNLAAAAAMHAGLDIDPDELSLDIVVAKSRPTLL